MLNGFPQFDSTSISSSSAHRLSTVARRFLPLTFVFGTVGLLLGAISGCLIDLSTECAVFRVSSIGAISGAVFSMEVVESSVALSHSSGSKLLEHLKVHALHWFDGQALKVQH